MALAPERADLRHLTLRDEHRLRRRLDRLRRGTDQAALERFAAEVAQAEERIGRRRAAVPATIAYPEELPVAARRDELLATIRDHQVVVVAGETGSGKTTQLPKLCLELGRGVRGAVAHTQPRRLAARTVAERIAEELGVPLGEAVGYAVRFSDRTREDTLVKLMTDGLLLAELQRDRLLRRYDTVIVDEAHERSLNIDFLLGALRQILPKRPDLKLIITSATIDPQRFAEHFGGAPVVEVSGRTYPVELRYRPPDEETDALEAIGDAVAELQREGRGDVLVFLSGEREIRDAAEALRGRFAQLDVLPLYARLSAAEQQRVFRPPRGGPVRVVLATNVAETSLTVPGIRYVVDPGTARISRYSARLKVQRLPIEPVSQASANQRAGRCGRTSAGICIRLYGEDDFAGRPAFTDPEVLRTSLAAVILQMAAMGLGDVEAFPFLDPPDPRQIRDGVNLLTELGALERGRELTPLGRRLAALPVDPRMARMVVEADRLGCADEVIVIAAALSIQDPRERPAEKTAQADQAHARFAGEGDSDFLAYLHLWRYLREQGRELSGSAFRRRCRAEFLNFLRVREWQDLVAQLRGAAKQAGVSFNQAPAEPREIHTALLAGLLSHVGVKDTRRRGEYLGARGARFAIFPGSVVARRQPAWVMAAELVETSRLFAREVARIDPAWIEPLAGHLVRRTHDEARWSRKRGAAVATERVTLYGLPIVAGRTVALGRIDPEASRELFIRKALVEGDWDARHDVLRANAELRAELEALEDRARRRGVVVDDEAVFAFSDERGPAGVGGGAEFDRWWRDERRRRPDLLTMTREHLAAGDGVDARGFPDAWRHGDLVLALTYTFEPGHEHDGVTVHVPVTALGAVRPIGFEWLVPGLRSELVTALVRSLPKDVRRELVPAPDVAAQALARLRPRAEPLLPALARELSALRPVRVTPEQFDLDRLPPHLRMTFAVEDERGRVLARGHDLEALRRELRPRLRASLAAATPQLERRGLRDWPPDLTIPRTIELPGTGVRAFPALVDEGDAVGVRALDAAPAQAAAMRAGTRRLLALTVPSPARDVLGRLDRAAQLTLAVAPHGSARAAVEDCTLAAIDLLAERAGGPAWDARGFARLRAAVAGALAETTLQVARRVVAVLDAERAVRRLLEERTAAAFTDATRDVEAQLRRLLGPGFVARTGAAHLTDLERWLRAAERRLERLPDALAGDRDRMRAIHELEAAAAALPEPDPEVGRALEELRVAQFAPSLGVRGQVSAKRVRTLIGAAAG